MTHRRWVERNIERRADNPRRTSRADHATAMAYRHGRRTRAAAPARPATEARDEQTAGRGRRNQAAHLDNASSRAASRGESEPEPQQQRIVAFPFVLADPGHRVGGLPERGHRDARAQR